MEKHVIALDATFPLLASAIVGKASPEIALTEGVVLVDINRDGVRIGVEVVGVVAHHAVHIGGGIGGKDVLVGGDAHGFNVVGVLALTGCVLYQFIGNVIT